jgi:AbrB family looped-hinge helix DNA binding protein
LVGAPPVGTVMPPTYVVAVDRPSYYHLKRGNTVTTTVNTKGQVTIPEPLRRKYGFRPGTQVAWIERDGEIIPRPILPLEELYGYLRPKPGEQSMTALLLEERRAEREREDR